jgi:hypothetical protein
LASKPDVQHKTDRNAVPTPPSHQSTGVLIKSFPL